METISSTVDALRAQLPPANILPSNDVLVLSSPADLQDLLQAIEAAHREKNYNTLPACVALNEEAFEGETDEKFDMVKHALRQPITLDGAAHQPCIELTTASSEAEARIKALTILRQLYIHGILPASTGNMQLLKGDERLLREYIYSIGNSWLYAPSLQVIRSLPPLDAIFFSSRSGIHFAQLLKGHRDSHPEDEALSSPLFVGFWNKVRMSEQELTSNRPFLAHVTTELRAQLTRIMAAKNTKMVQIGVFDESTNTGKTRQNMQYLLSKALRGQGEIHDISGDSGAVRGSYGTWQTADVPEGRKIVPPHHSEMPLVSAAHQFFLTSTRIIGRIAKRITYDEL